MPRPEVPLSHDHLVASIRAMQASFPALVSALGTSFSQRAGHRMSSSPAFGRGDFFVRLDTAPTHNSLFFPRCCLRIRLLLALEALGTTLLHGRLGCGNHYPGWFGRSHLGSSLGMWGARFFWGSMGPLDGVATNANAVPPLNCSLLGLCVTSLYICSRYVLMDLENSLKDSSTC